MTWSEIEIGVLARAVSHAPSVHNSQPWVLEIRGDTAGLYERPDVALPRHDRSGRDRVISCGAALVNLDLAVRALGRRPEVTLLPDPSRPDLLARVGVTGPGEASEPEGHRYSAIFQRSSYRAPFALHRVARGTLRELAAAAGAVGVAAHLMEPRTEAAHLAELLGHAGAMLRDDGAYQRELVAWSSQFREPIAEDGTLPWSGLVRADTHLPDVITLTERISAESLLIVLTADDTRLDHLRAGAAMQRAWLTAVAAGPAGSVLTQPLHLPEVRAGLVERLELPGYPQAILRLGYPVTSVGVLAGMPVTEASGTVRD